MNNNENHNKSFYRKTNIIKYTKKKPLTNE